MKILREFLLVDHTFNSHDLFDDGLSVDIRKKKFHADLPLELKGLIVHKDLFKPLVKRIPK